MPAIDREPAQMRAILRQLRPRDRANQPWPQPGGDGTNARYELTQKFVGLLRAFDHAGMIVLVDRVDEPTLVAGRAERMRSLVWPMLESKFLQQEGVGIKMLLPIELHRCTGGGLLREVARQAERGGPARVVGGDALRPARPVRACHKDNSKTDGAFAEDAEALDALGQMAQPATRSS
jgi:hypothetical protein